MDYLGIVFNIIAIVFLVLLNGFFVASEFAIVKIRNSRIDMLIQDGNKRAVYARKVTENLDAYLSVTQLGITLASLGLGWFGEPAVAYMLRPVFEKIGISPQLEHSIAFVVGFSVITAMHIVLGELVPKSLAIQKTENVVLWISWPLILFNKLMYPAVWILNNIANKILNFIGVEPATEAEEAHNEEEIRILMEESHKHGYIDKTEMTYLGNVFSFSERLTIDIMVPRIDMICMYLDKPFEENIRIALKERMTRYPICDGDKDHIIGFLHIKDLLRVLNEGKKPDLRDLARDVIVVPKSLPISNLLRRLQKHRSQLAVIIDEYGGTAGMVTIEDILEEIVGDIQDEFDEERAEFEQKDLKIYSVDGKVLLEDIRNYFKINIDDNNCDTIGGWLYTMLDFCPVVGKTFEYQGYRFIVEEMDKIRIIRIKIVLPDTVEKVEK